MLEARELTFTQEELASAAQTNLVGLIVAATQFVQAQEMEVDAFWHFVGQKYAPFWTGIDNGEAETVARGIAHNMASCGAKVETLSSDAGQARLVFNDYPPADALADYDIAAEDMARMCEVFRPMVEALDLTYSWELEGDTVTMIIKH